MARPRSAPPGRRLGNDGDLGLHSVPLPTKGEARAMLQQKLLQKLGNEKSSLPAKDSMKPDEFIKPIETLLRSQHDELLNSLEKRLTKMEEYLRSDELYEPALTFPVLPPEPDDAGFYPPPDDGDDDDPNDLPLLEKIKNAKRNSDRASRASVKLREAALQKGSDSKAGLGEEDEGEPGYWIRIQRAADQLVRSLCFESFFSAAIVVNSALLGFQVQWLAQNRRSGQEVPLWPGFYVAQFSFASMFLFELVVRMVAAGSPKAFLSDEKNTFWNWMDTVIVLASMMETVVTLQTLFADTDEEDSKSSVTSNVRLLRIIRITRVMRALRVVKLVRFVRALNTLVQSIISTLNSFVWALLLLLLIIYLFAIVFTEMITGYVSDNGYVTAELDVDSGIGTLANKFGSLWMSMITLFESISGGMDWADVGDPMFEVDPMWGLIFTLYISFVCFAVLNVMTGVFCEGAIQSARKNQESMVQDSVAAKLHEQRQFKTLFKTLSQDYDELSLTDLETSLKSEEIIANFHALCLDPDDAWKLFKLLDVDGDASVECGEFVEGCMRLKGAAKSIDIATLLVDSKIMRQGLTRLEETQDAIGQLVKDLSRRSTPSSKDRSTRSSLSKAGTMPSPERMGSLASIPEKPLPGVVDLQ